MKFQVRVQVSDSISFKSDVYKIQGNEFLLYNDDTGFGWYSILSMFANRPMITLVRGEEDDAAYHTHKCPQDCPLFKTDDCYFINMSDALELLKEQEPRVLTLEEMKALGVDDVVWFEELDDSGKSYIQPMIVCPDGELYGVHLGVSIYYMDLHRRRFWSARPTDEQMEATPWQ